MRTAPARRGGKAQGVASRGGKGVRPGEGGAEAKRGGKAKRCGGMGGGGMWLSGRGRVWMGMGRRRG